MAATPIRRGFSLPISHARRPASRDSGEVARLRADI
jgi:hypothetical protein